MVKYRISVLNQNGDLVLVIYHSCKDLHEIKEYVMNNLFFHNGSTCTIVSNDTGQILCTYNYDFFVPI